LRILRLLRSKFARDAATLQVGALINTASNLCSSMVLAHLLGAHHQGEFMVALALYSLFTIAVNLGLTHTTVNQLASASVRGRDEKVAAWLAFLVKAYGGIGLLLVPAGYFLLPALAEWLYGDRQLGVWAWWLTVIPVVELPRVVCCAAFQGTRRMLPLAQTENGQEVVRMFLVIVGAALTGSSSGAWRSTCTAGHGTTAPPTCRRCARCWGACAPRGWAMACGWGCGSASCATWTR